MKQPRMFDQSGNSTGSHGDGSRQRSARRRGTVVAAVAAAGMLALSACGGGGDDAAGGGEDKLLNEGEIVVAMSGEFQPFSYFEDGQLAGFDYDIAAAIAEELGLELKAETGTFSTLIGGVKAKRYDVLIASMTPNEERDKQVDFTDGYYSSGAQVFVRSDSECKDPTGLEDAVFGVATGTTYEDYLNENDLAGEVRNYDSDVVALKDLGAGRLDAAMTDKLVGLYQIKQAGLDLRTCGEPLYTEEPAFAVREGNKELVNDLNEALASIKDDGTYAEISEKWFGEDIS